ncbi:hypothetical protein ACGFIV_24975 [Sphaerisporangium sp. NPDC049003]
MSTVLLMMLVSTRAWSWQTPLARHHGVSEPLDVSTMTVIT